MHSKLVALAIAHGVCLADPGEIIDDRPYLISRHDISAYDPRLLPRQRPKRKGKGRHKQRWTE